MSVLFNNTFFDDLMDELSEDPNAAINNCQKAYAKVEEFHENATYLMIGFLCAYVLEIKRSPKELRTLTEHKDWVGRRPKPDTVTLTGTRFAMKAWETKTELYERARIYSKVIDYYLSIDTDPADVPDRLAVTKISGVLKLIAKQEKEATLTEQQAHTPSNKPSQQPTGAVLKRSETDDRVNGPVLLRLGANGLVPVRRVDNSQHVGDDRNLPVHRSNNDLDESDNDDSPPKLPSPIRINEGDDIYFSAGRHFFKFSRLRIGEEIVVKLRRVADDEGRWAYRAISAEVVDMDEAGLLH